MQKKDQEFLKRINEYADTVMADIDPQKTPISVQLDRLRPVMTAIAQEEKCSLEDVFIRYMDLASEAAVEREQEFQGRLE